MKMAHSKSDTRSHILRISTGLVLLGAGITKQFLGAAAYQAPAQVPEAIRDFVTMTLPWFEIVAGVLLILGAFTMVVSTITALFFLGAVIFMGPFMAGIFPAYHTYMLLTNLAIAAGGNPSCCSIDASMMKKKSESVKKIKA